MVDIMTIGTTAWGGDVLVRWFTRDEMSKVSLPQDASVRMKILLLSVASIAFAYLFGL